MSTYYNYVRRGTESQVDWGRIGSDISTEITRIAQDRDQKRQDLDKLNTDLIKSASEVAIPEQEYVRNLVLNGTNEMKNLALMNNDLLKRGMITPAQYRMTMENMKSNVSNLDKAVKEFGPAYEKAMQRLNNGEMPWLEQQQKEKLFKYGNLQSKTLFVAPDGNMYITDMDDNGNPVADKKKMMNVGVMATGLGYEMKKYNTLEELEKGVNSIGQVVDIVRKGGVFTTESAMNNPEYKSARDKYISAMMGNPMNIVSIMGDYIGGYNSVDDESQAGGKNIYIDSNGVPKPTADQVAEVKKTLETQFDAMVSKKATPMPIQQPSEGAGRAASKEAEIGKNLGLLIFGSGPESDVAARSLASQNSNIESITRENGVIRITTSDGNYQDFDQNREGMNAELLARDIVGYLMPSGISSIDKVISKAEISPTRPMSLAPIKYTKTQASQSFKPVAETPILSEDGKSLIMASAAINLIDPDGGKEEEVQAIISQIDPRLSVTTESNTIGKDRLTLYLDGQPVGTIDYDDSKDKVQLINLIDQARSQKKQGSTTQQTQSGQVDYTKV